MQDKQHNSRERPSAEEGGWNDSIPGSSRGGSDSVQVGWMRAWQEPADLQAGCTEDSPKEFVKSTAAHSNPRVLI